MDTQMQTAEINLPYHKQGADLSYFLSVKKKPTLALKAHADMLESAAKQLRDVAAAVANRKVEINADVHFITISGADDLIASLLKQGLVEAVPHNEDD